MGKGTTNAVGNALCDFAFDFSESTSRAERFAAKRFQSKLEHPDSTKAAQRRNSCWEQWRSFDHNLSRTGLFRPNWAIARLLVWKILREFHLGPVSFTNGSEFEPTLGHNSIESKLSRSVWTCTPDNFDLWAQTVYSHRALKTAFRRRYRRWLASKRVSQVRTD